MENCRIDVGWPGRNGVSAFELRVGFLGRFSEKRKGVSAV